jgi:hypothetical protein
MGVLQLATHGCAPCVCSRVALAGAVHRQEAMSGAWFSAAAACSVPGLPQVTGMRLDQDDDHEVACKLASPPYVGVMVPVQPVQAPVPHLLPVARQGSPASIQCLLLCSMYCGQYAYCTCCVRSLLAGLAERLHRVSSVQLCQQSGVGCVHTWSVEPQCNTLGKPLVVFETAIRAPEAVELKVPSSGSDAKRAQQRNLQYMHKAAPDHLDVMLREVLHPVTSRRHTANLHRQTMSGRAIRTPACVCTQTSTARLQQPV